MLRRYIALKLGIVENRVKSFLGLKCVQIIYFLLFPRMLQSVRRHSTIVLTVTTNGMQELHPVMCLSPIKVQSQLIVYDHWNRRTTVGGSPLDEWSARRTDLYLTTHNTHNRQTFVLLAGFEPTISAGERPQTYVSDGATTGTGELLQCTQNVNCPCSFKRWTDGTWFWTKRVTW